MFSIFPMFSTPGLQDLTSSAAPAENTDYRLSNDAKKRWIGATFSRDAESNLDRADVN